MKYYTWKLKWVVSPSTGSEEGWEPTSFSNDAAVTFEQTFRSSQDITNKTTKTYGVSAVDVNISDWSDYLMEEITAQQALTAAQLIDEGAVMDEEGLIIFTPAPVF